MKLNLVIIVSVIAGLLLSEPVQSEENEYGVLVDKAGVEDVHAYCTACHSERIVAQQGLSKEGWLELLEWMVDEQEMEEIEEPDFSRILNYLAENYNIDRPNFPK